MFTGADGQFVPLDIEQQITEMDVSVYTGSAENFPAPPADRLLKQAYVYRDMFALFRRYSGEITSVTLWGLADDNTWLDTFPVTCKDAPLLFDTRLQAKSAYRGVADPARIETSPSPGAPSCSPPVPASSCAVTYRVAGTWPGGFQGDVKITNTGGTALTSWTLAWQFTGGQRISQLWGGGHTQSGAAVTVADAGWNAAVAAVGSVSFGFLGGWTGANPAPAAFTLNGTACTVL